MKLFKVTFEENMLVEKRTVQFVNARDEDEAKRKAKQRGTKGIHWDICIVEEIEEDDN